MRRDFERNGTIPLFAALKMKDAKVQSLRSLREEMKAVGRGEKPAPADASKPSFNSVEAIVRLLTPDNRRLLALIRDRKPRSVAELVTMTGRAQPNLTRTLAKFEARSVRWANRTGVCQAASRAAIRRGDRKAGAGAIDVVVLSVGRRQRRRGAIVADV
jgi:predicted transcriptional regulator